jgi:hypothetical protein
MPARAELVEDLAFGHEARFLERIERARSEDRAQYGNPVRHFPQQSESGEPASRRGQRAIFLQFNSSQRPAARVPECPAAGACARIGSPANPDLPALSEE